MGIGWVGLATLALGLFSALRPRQSIALYIWLMARINWRVAPVNEALEIRNTRLLGIFLTLLSIALLLTL